jgi:hypothetical protein
MMDQLASIGVEFDDHTINRIFNRNKNYFHIKAAEDRAKREAKGEKPPLGEKILGWFGKGQRKWAMEPIYGNNGR